MNATVEFSVIDCPQCGIQYAITRDYEKRRRADHAQFQCPAGHHQHFPEKTDEEYLRKLARERGGKIVTLQDENAELRRRLSRRKKK